MRLLKIPEFWELLQRVFFLETLKGAASGSGRGGGLLMALDHTVTRPPILRPIIPYIGLCVLAYQRINVHAHIHMDCNKNISHQSKG